jgi:hypothetical protein
MPGNCQVILIRKTLIWITTIILIGCSARDKNLEINLSNKLIEFRQNDNETLDLRTVFGNEWEKICIQGPYMDQEHFEKMTGRKVRGFEFVSDDVYVFWVFYKDINYKWAKILRATVMNKKWNKGPMCTNISKPFLYSTDSDGRKEYYFTDQEIGGIGVK